MDPWWTEQGAGIAGAIIGGGGGSIFGGIGGGIGGPLAAMGKARSFVLGFFWLAILTGAALAIAGLVALALGQPWFVWTVLLGPGALIAGLAAGLLPVIRQRYRDHERRRLAAEELRRA